MENACRLSQIILFCEGSHSLQQCAAVCSSVLAAVCSSVHENRLCSLMLIKVSRNTTHAKQYFENKLSLKLCAPSATVFLRFASPFWAGGACRHVVECA